MSELEPSDGDGGTPAASVPEFTPSSTWRKKPSQKGKPRLRLVKHATPKPPPYLRKRRKAGAGVDGERPKPVRRKLDLDGERRSSKIITDLCGKFRRATLMDNVRSLAKLYLTDKPPARTPPPASPKMNLRSFPRAQLMDNLRSLAKHHNLPDDVANVAADGQDAKGKNRTNKKPMMVDALVLVPYNKKRAAVAAENRFSSLVIRDRKFVPRWTTVALAPVKTKDRLVKDITPAIEAAYNELMRLDETCRGEDLPGIPESPDLKEKRVALEKQVARFMAVARMIMGDKKFDDPPWKGSVVTSVVGTFLTQNVTDNMSSNAFMNLAAKFPKNGSNVKQSTSIPLVTDGCDLGEAEPGDAGSANERGNCRDKGIEELLASLRTGEISNWKKESIRKVLRDRFGSSTAAKIFNDIASIRDTSHWNSLIKEAYERAYRKGNIKDETVDWEALLHAPFAEIAECIRDRGNQSQMAFRILAFLIRIKRDHGSIDLEWLRCVPRAKAKRYLRSINGLGAKSVDCIRLLSLRHRAFPVDTNVARIVTRLGWVELQPLPNDQEFHLVNTYPVMADIQKYLEPLLCKIPARAVHELHLQMITFGKSICTKRQPNCGECPLRDECKYFKSLASRVERAFIEYSQQHERGQTNMGLSPEQMHQYQIEIERGTERHCNEPIVEIPTTPPHEDPGPLSDEEFELGFHDIDIEDQYDAVIDLRSNKPTENVVTGPAHGKEIIPSQTPASSTRMINNYHLRTEYTAYEILDGHEILDEFEPRVPGDCNKYLLIIRSRLDEHTVKATILIPCRTANRDVFPLDGTYFQHNEVFADHLSSRSPIEVKTKSIWPLKQCTVYFGTSIHSVSKGQTLQGLHQFFDKGYICDREFDRSTRCPKVLSPLIHATNVHKGTGRKRPKTYSNSGPEKGNDKDGAQSN